MPMVDGKKVRARYTALKLGELSAVDRPAQPGATVACFKAFNPNQPRDPAGTDTGGQWSGRSGTSGKPHKLEGVMEYGFAPTVLINEAGDDDPEYGDDTRTGPLYDAAHAQLRQSFDLSDGEAHAVLTSRVGRHMADEIGPKDGPKEVRSRIKGYTKSTGRHGWAPMIRDHAKAWTDGEGEWPVGLEELRAAKVVTKYVCDTDGAHSFIEVLHENEFSQKIWPFTDALSQSIRSIVGDKRLTGDEREDKINKSVASFLQKVRDISPKVAKQLEGLIKKGSPMPKSADQLEAELAKATGELTAMTARAEKAEKDFADMKDAKGKVDEECKTAKAALLEATDETITVGGQDLKKSVVGEANFTVAKALRDERDIAVLEKRASDEFGHVVGSAAEKALVIKAIEGLPTEEAKKAGLAILQSAEKMAKGAFALIGSNGGPAPTEKQLESSTKFEAEVQKNVDAGMKESEAMSKARRDHPQLFADTYGDGAAASN